MGPGKTDKRGRQAMNGSPRRPGRAKKKGGQSTDGQQGVLVIRYSYHALTQFAFIF